MKKFQLKKEKECVGRDYVRANVTFLFQNVMLLKSQVWASQSVSDK